MTEEDDERLEVVEEREDGGDGKGWDVLSVCGGLAGCVSLVCVVTVGLGDRIGGLTVLPRLDELEAEVEEAVLEVGAIAVVAGNCEALLTASHMDTPTGAPPTRLDALVKVLVP